MFYVYNVLSTKTIAGKFKLITKYIPNNYIIKLNNIYI